jgi:hypothetical protein
MNTLILIVAAFGVGSIVTAGAFIWLNRNKPSALDAIESATRKQP